MGTVGLMEAVDEAAADEVPVAAGKPERQQRGVGDVGDRVGHWDRRRQRGARLLGADRLMRDDEDRLEARGGVEARGSAVGADHEAAVQRRRDVVGVALQLAGQRQHVGVKLEEMVGG